MAETKRPWWKVKRVIGVILGVTGTALATIPAAPVIGTIGAIAITTQTAAVIITGVGVYVFGYGKGSADERKKK